MVVNVDVHIDKLLLDDGNYRNSDESLWSLLQRAGE